MTETRATPTTRVDPGAFTPAAELHAWQAALDRRGLRATGSPAHADYVADLAVRLAAQGVSDVHTEALPMNRWTPVRWQLQVGGVDVPLVSPVSYSGATGPGGVRAPLSTEPTPGAVGVVEVAVAAFPAATFDALDWHPEQVVHAPGYRPEQSYERVSFSQDTMRAELARFADAGAAGLVIVVDLPAAHLPGAYLLYDGVHRGLPAVFASREQGPGLLAAAGRGAEAHLVLDAVVEPVETHNVVGLVPGAGDELVVLHSHTDGPNGIEDNGPEALLAMAGHLAALPAGELPRSVLVLLSTGHFAIEEAWGVEAWLARHAADLVPRVAAVLSLEHLGALPGRLDTERAAADGLPLPPYEFGCAFTSPHGAVVDVVRRALERAGVTENRVLRPFVPDTTGRSPDGLSWPGDGCPFWHTAGLPTANVITGPDYLFNVEPVLDFVDVEAMRRQAIAFTEATLELAALPWATLHARTDAG